MFRSFEEAEAFIGKVLQETLRGDVVWKENPFGGFIQAGHEKLLSFCLLSEDTDPVLTVRGRGEAFDVVISPAENEQHRASIVQLLKCVHRKMGLLF